MELTLTGKQLILAELKEQLEVAAKLVGELQATLESDWCNTQKRVDAVKDKLSQAMHDLNKVAWIYDLALSDFYRDCLDRKGCVEAKVLAAKQALKERQAQVQGGHDAQQTKTLIKLAVDQYSEAWKQHFNDD